MNQPSRRLKSCRLCNGKFDSHRLLLASTPPANQLASSKEQAISMSRFPLELAMCAECKHLQLIDIVDPEVLFSDYIYRSGTSQTFVTHFSELATIIQELEKSTDFIVEVGSNDGTLLESLSNLGYQAIGIEPSGVLADFANQIGRRTIQGFFNNKTMDSIIKTHGKPSVIVGNNVFAHIDDLNSAFDCAYNHIDDSGFFIFEVANVSRIISEGIFDTIYHEHMSYHSVTALRKLAAKHKFVITRIDQISTHGGSFRFFLQKDDFPENSSDVEKFIVEEKKFGLDSNKAIERIENHVNRIRQETRDVLSQLKKTPNVKLIGYGAPAKVVTFLAAMEIENIELVGIIDDNEFKQGKFLPGSGIRITSSSSLQSELLASSEAPTIVCLVFPWNLGAEVEKKLKSWLPKGSTIVTFFPSISKVVC